MIPFKPIIYPNGSGMFDLNYCRYTQTQIFCLISDGISRDVIFEMNHQVQIGLSRHHEQLMLDNCWTMSTDAHALSQDEHCNDLVRVSE